ncbi:Amino-acid carrier protein AlsT [bioreactor metagenome]|jgi:amino acid carrier protein|uniref:Amino-acid carrier protein AlsT n=1 Tax=bioreactor metagenome TaxID=1076179 RepID=A0A644UIV1_9ZZZZ|nr:sodium:alanine symporter family protein [Acidaminococcaceae bacterium]
MTDLNGTLVAISGLVWGIPLLVLLVGTGIFLTVKLRLLQVRKLVTGFKIAFMPSDCKDSEGDISQFQALMTALAATIGTGNIVGVATAVVAGGPGALFWMWASAFFGMATKYAEAILAVRFRERKANGSMAGGPMYYIKNGMQCKWLAAVFAFFGAFAAFGIGNMVQSNAVALVVKENFGVPAIYTGAILTVFTAMVILGGIKGIGKATGIIVPAMATFYLVGGLIIIFMNLDKIPATFAIIFGDAFTGHAVAGGALGTVIRFGVSRGVFSNEAGLGSAPIAAAAAKTDMPGRQALVSMLGTFLDTIIVCSVTGLVVVMSGLWKDGAANGAALTSQAFNSFLPNVGNNIVAIGLIFFAYSTILGWCYYGEKCFEYLAGEKVIMGYRIVYTLAVFIGSISSLSVVWNLADIFNGLMALPNLIAIVVLSGVVFEETRAFEIKLQEEKENKIAMQEQEA